MVVGTRRHLINNDKNYFYVSENSTRLPVELTRFILPWLQIPSRLLVGQHLWPGLNHNVASCRDMMIALRLWLIVDVKAKHHISTIVLLYSVLGKLYRNKMINNRFHILSSCWSLFQKPNRLKELNDSFAFYTELIKKTSSCFYKESVKISHHSVKLTRC